MRQKAYAARISGFDQSNFIESNRESAFRIHRNEDESRTTTRSKFGSLKQSMETEACDEI